MNPDNSETETSAGISEYFDDALSTAECSELAVRLRSDPAAALEFARTARVHALLDAAAPHRPAGRAVVLRRRWLGLGAAAALIAAGSFAAVQYFGKSSDPSPAPHIVIKESDDSHIDRKPLPPGVNLRTVRATAPAAAGPVNLDHLLANFTVHAYPNGLTVPEALQALERVIAQSNVLNRRELAALRFTAGRVVIPPGLGPEGTQLRLKIQQRSAKLTDLVRQWEAAAEAARSARNTETLKDQLIEAEAALETADAAGKKKRPGLTKRVQELEAALAAAHEKHPQQDASLKQMEARDLALQIKSVEREIDALRIEKEIETPRPSDPENPRINTPLPGPYTIKEYLNICSLYREVRQEPGGIIYGVPVAPGPAGPGDHQETKTFRLPPDLFGYWFPRGENYPETGVVGLLDEIRSTARTAWAKAGGEASASPSFPGPPSFPPVGSLKYSRKNSTITVEASQLALERWEQILNVCTQRKHVQHYITTQYILCPAELLPAGFDAKTGMILSREKSEDFFRTLSQAANVMITAAPDVVVRPGQRNAIQTLYEVPNSQPVEPLSSDWFGLQQELLTTCVGETIQASGMVDLGLPSISGLTALPELLNRDKPAGAGNPSHKYVTEGAQHHRTGFDLWIPNRCTALFTLDVNTGDSRTVLACLTAQVLDPAGQPTGP